VLVLAALGIRRLDLGLVNVALLATLLDVADGLALLLGNVHGVLEVHVLGRGRCLWLGDVLLAPDLALSSHEVGGRQSDAASISHTLETLLVVHLATTLHFLRLVDSF
jgi:hypothetical protein